MKAILIIIVGIIIPLIFGCSNDKLTRGKAEKLIREIYKFPYDEIDEFNIAFPEGPFDNTSKLDQLQNEGLLTYSKYSFMGWFITGDLTEKGKQYAVSDKYGDNYTKYVKVKAAKLDFGEITGIQEIKGSNTAMVNYTLIRKDITPFGRIKNNFNEGTLNTSVSFTKYDDGWRINTSSIQFYESLPKNEIRKQVDESSKRIEVQELVNQSSSDANSIINASWITLKTQLQRRADLFSSIIKATEASQNFETPTLQAVVDAMAKANSINVDINDPMSVKAYQNAQEKLMGSFVRLLVSFERYPDVKTTRAFQDFQTQSEGIENRINAAINEYNDLCKKYGRLDILFGSE